MLDWGINTFMLEFEASLRSLYYQKFEEGLRARERDKRRRQSPLDRRRNSFFPSLQLSLCLLNFAREAREGSESLGRAITEQGKKRGRNE